MKYKLLYLLLTISSISFAQIGVVEVPEEPILVGRAGKKELSLPSLKYIESDSGKYYMITYQNAEYQITDIKTFGFTASEEDIEYLYNFLKDGFGKDEDRYLDVGNVRINTLVYMRKYIAVFVKHENDTDGFFYLSQENLDKLFGKEN